MRFIINLPQEELESVERICFQVEEAQWYYEDFIRPLDPDLPSLNLRNFCLRIFQHCPLLSEFSPDHHATAFEEFLAYKTRVPVRGAIMLNDEMDEVVLVKGWKKNANWSFPRGKINKDESDLDCAVREVYEETGYDIEAAGLVGPPETTKYIDVAIQHQHVRLYVFRGVPPNTLFEARTRKEISKIEWWKLSDLPTFKKKKQQQEGRGEDLASNANRFYMVAPFLVPLKKWISQQRKSEKPKDTDELQTNDNEAEEVQTESNGREGVKAASTPDDMERLLAGLRQPARAPVTSNMKISCIMASAEEASLHLKQLLQVPTGSRGEGRAQRAPAPPAEPASQSSEAKRASTLLALLKGGSSTQKRPAPQTPMEQITDPPSAPKSPKPHHALPPRVSTLPPPPVFPLSPDDDAQIRLSQPSRPNSMAKASIVAWNNFETTAAGQEATRQTALVAERAARLADEGRTGVRHQLTLPAMNETWRQVKTDPGADMRKAGQRQVASVVKRSVGGPQHSHQDQTERVSRQQPALKAASHPAPAPYQATSNVPVTANSQYPDIYRPAIPPANKLPIPKLSAHSSSLLDLFKGPQSTQATQKDSAPPVAVTNSVAKSPGEMTKAKEQADHPSDLRVISGLSSVRKTGESTRPQPSHQATLLDLFRKPSVPAAGLTPPPKATLEVPADLVELSAAPSPGHSREPSKADVNEPQKGSRPRFARPISIQKRPQASAKNGQPPVFATVSGPLNVPHFETIASKARESAQKPAAVKDVKKSPVTILARPANPKAQASADQPKDTKINGLSVNGPSILPSIGLDHIGKRSPSSKQFQPQILRRPPQPDGSAYNFSAPTGSSPSASLIQSSDAPALWSGSSGDMYNLPQRTVHGPHHPSNNPVPEMKTQLLGVKKEDLPEAYQEKDLQSFLVVNAPSKQGQPTPRQQHSHQSATEPHANARQEPAVLPPIPSTMEKRNIPSPLSASERGTSVKSNHQATLLSLFTNTSSPMPSPGGPSRQDLFAFVSPVTATPPPFPPYLPRDGLSKSRLSNFTAPGNGNVVGGINDAADVSKAKQTPKKMTSDVDRSFLLGYLEGVARKEGK